MRFYITFDGSIRLVKIYGNNSSRPLKKMIYVQEVVTHLLYVQEVVTLQKQYLIYLHQKMRFTPFINYYDTFG